MESGLPETGSGLPALPVGGDQEMERITGEEERALGRVLRTLDARRSERPQAASIDYDAELLALRDQIQEARLEDIPPLVEEMERLQQVASRRAQVTVSHVDRDSPYFGRLVLDEGDRTREVLIGRGTFLDSRTGIRIVDWRDAPVSRVYYRYEEGDDYEEDFGGRAVEGEVRVRRSLTIADGVVRRIGARQGTFIRERAGAWHRADANAMHLHGGQGTAMRPEAHHRPGKLGTGSASREDKHLPEITALIDPRQFDLITKPSAGLVVIQGGAGSGKTTVGLHRMAYLAFQDPRRFRADRMLVVVFNEALARYISRVLPALGVGGVAVVTFEAWARKLRVSHLRGLPKGSHDGTPATVVRLKKHPAMLRLIDVFVDELTAQLNEAFIDVAKRQDGGARVIRAWNDREGMALLARITSMQRWLLSSDVASLSLGSKHALERTLAEGKRRVGDVSALWAEILTDRSRIRTALDETAPEAFGPQELRQAHDWCVRRCSEALRWRDAADAGEDRRPRVGVDGASDEEHSVPPLDAEDDALLLRLVQRIEGPLRTPRGTLSYEHVFVDEAQDLSPVELAVVLDTVTEGRSVTFAGDVAQRLLADNGFSDWRGVLRDLGLEHIEVEPLRLAYRSTHEIIEFAGEVLGPLRTGPPAEAQRRGGPVELFRFGQAGEAVAFLSEALRELALAEPVASVAVIARYPEQAELYYRGLQQGEVPRLRWIVEEDFPFRPGVDVTDVRQVKGLEFDYVVLVEVSAATYPVEDEARHLLHIAATRAAHQLWLTTSGPPSLLIPDALRQRGDY